MSLATVCSGPSPDERVTRYPATLEFGGASHRRVAPSLVTPEKVTPVGCPGRPYETRPVTSAKGPLHCGLCTGHMYRARTRTRYSASSCSPLIFLNSSVV